MDFGIAKYQGADRSGRNTDIHLNVRDSKIFVFDNGKQIHFEKVDLEWTDKAIHLLISIEFKSGLINFFQKDKKLGTGFKFEEFKTGHCFACCDFNTLG